MALRRSMCVLEKGGHKLSTGMVGLAVNPNSRADLISIYGELLEEIKKVPEGVPYRISVEKTTNKWLDLLNKEEDVRVIEQQTGGLQLEEMIEDAKCELELIPELLEQPPWELAAGDDGKRKLIIKD